MSKAANMEVEVEDVDEEVELTVAKMWCVPDCSFTMLAMRLLQQI